MSSMRPVTPCRPPAPYVGGKRHLSAVIAERIAAIPHSLYAEPMVGMGGVFFRRAAAPPTEVINDASRDVATLFRVLQRHYVAFLDMLRWQLTTRADFERLMATPPDTMTDLERAARFLYLQRTGFGGKVVGRVFGVTYDTAARFDVSRVVPVLEEVHARLSRVVIECLDWQAFIDRYDRPGTLFYLDPPYWGTESYYGPGFARADFERLAERLARLKATFLLSLNDTAGVREVFGRFALEPVETIWSVSGGVPKRAPELLITPAGEARDAR
jgi:DNA adenine methylase